MSNKLKDIFSNSDETYESKLKFKDNDAYRNFLVALETVEKDGSTIAVDGIESVSLFLQDHGIKFPVEQATKVSKLIVGPSIEPVEFPVTWENGSKNFKFNRYHITEGTVLETQKNNVVHLKLIFCKNIEKVKMTYKIHYKHAKNVENIVFELEAFICFLKKIFCETTISANKTDDIKKVQEVLSSLNYAEKFMQRVLSLEKILDVSFKTDEMDAMSSDDQTDVEELYLLLCEKKPLRINAKLETTDTKLQFTDIQREFRIGGKFAAVFHREAIYNLFGEEFTIYLINVLFNATIKDYKNNGNITHIYYGDTDSEPMYVSYLAFLNEEDAKKEAKKKICNNPKYINAITTAEHIEKRLKALQDSK